jgi:hypothetical protein
VKRVGSVYDATRVLPGAANDRRDAPDAANDIAYGKRVCELRPRRRNIGGSRGRDR